MNVSLLLPNLKATKFIGTLKRPLISKGISFEKKITDFYSGVPLYVNQTLKICTASLFPHFTRKSI